MTNREIKRAAELVGVDRLEEESLEDYIERIFYKIDGMDNSQWDELPLWLKADYNNSGVPLVVKTKKYKKEYSSEEKPESKFTSIWQWRAKKLRTCRATIPTLCHKCSKIHPNREAAINCCPDPVVVDNKVKPLLESIMVKWVRGGYLENYL